MSVYLDDEVDLVVSDGLPLLVRCGSGISHPLKLEEAVATTLLAAIGELKPAQKACERALGRRGGEWVEQVANRFWPYFGGTGPRELDITQLESLDAERLDALNSRRPEPAPASIVWLVTLACNRRCPYCFYAVTPHSADAMDPPADAAFRHDRVDAMLHEMAILGASDLYLTGGEPLLRRDLPDLIATATALRVRTHLTTKFAIERSLADRLAEAGLTSIIFSLDDARSRQADGLAGAAGFLTEAIEALEALLEAGFSPEVNAVATTVNVGYLGGLAELLSDVGVTRLTVSPYVLPYPARTVAKRLLPDPGLDLEAHVRQLQERMGNHFEVRMGNAEAAANDAQATGRPVCDVGVRELHVLPDGRATRCRYLPGRDDLIVGSLNEMTILDIWEGSQLDALTHPSRQVYAGTACASCAAFNACNSRGRCYVSALEGAGRLHAPDAFCRFGGRL